MSSLRVAVAVAVVLACCGAALAQTRFRTMNQSTTDGREKTSIVQHVLVTGPADEATIREEMLDRLDRARARTGFLYRDAASEILIHIYVTETEAHAADGRWVARLVYDAALGEEPAISFDQERLRTRAARTSPATSSEAAR